MKKKIIIGGILVCLISMNINETSIINAANSNKKTISATNYIKKVSENMVKNAEDTVNDVNIDDFTTATKAELIIQNSVIKHVWATKDIEIKEKANKDSRTIGALKKGEDVVGLYADGWVAFDLNDKTVYIHEENITETEIDKETFMTPFTGWTNVNLNVREKQSDKANIVGLLQKGTKIQGKADENWVMIEYKGKKAYVMKKYVSQDEVKTEKENVYTGYAKYRVNVREEKSKESKLLGTIDIGQKVEGILEDGYVLFVYNGVLGYVNTEYLSDTEVQRTNEKTPFKGYTANVINIREKASERSKILGQMPVNTEVEGIVDGDWLEIKHNGQKAYLSHFFLSEEKITVAKEKEDEIKFSGFTTNRLRVREKASTNAKIQGVLNEATKVEGIVDGEWLKILYNGNTGYISKNYVSDKKPSKTTNADIEEQQMTTGVQGMVDLAKSLVGKPYSYGSSGPNAFDCSGFTSYLYRNVMGINLPRNSGGQSNTGVEVGLDSLQAGDILYFPNHVAFYIGGGSYIHASTYGTGVTYGNMNDWYTTRSIQGARRII